MSTSIKYDFEPAQPTPGEDYEKFEERLLNAAAAESDDRGWSLADPFLGLVSRKEVRFLNLNAHFSLRKYVFDQ